MIARVALEIALRKEFDYLIPEELAGRVEVGSRVKVPFGHREVMGCVTTVLEQTEQKNLRPIVKVIGTQSLVTPKVLQLAKWIADYYCCPQEIALKSVLPEAVRKEKDGWKEQLYVRALTQSLPDSQSAGEKGISPGQSQSGTVLKLTKRQQEVWKVVQEKKEIALQELLQLTETTAETVRRLEDKGLVSIAPQISERDPYAKENILPTEPLPLNAEQKAALERIQTVMNEVGVDLGSTRVPRVRSDAAAEKLPLGISDVTFRRRRLSHLEIPGRTYHITWRTHEKLILSAEACKATLSACHFWHGKKIHCHIACVMPDHVHVIIRPLPVPQQENTVYSLSEILQSIKSYSAHDVNKIMGRTGFVWNDESFDRMIRSEDDLDEKWNYIWNNPRKIGLVRPMEGYQFIWYPQDEVELSNPRDAGATQGGVTPKSKSSVFLLHGITGSGKTEVYLQAIAHALEQGKGAIVLVPEISLTPQTVERFKARFSSGRLKTLVAVLHSHLSSGERHDEWHKIRQGRAKIVIGARSAIFAPVDPLGLIIVDEEHEHSYKQEESPRYHARDVAVLRGQMENAVVVLGSATPSMESYANAQKGKYALIELPHRADDKKLPHIKVIDMRQAARLEKGTPIFSPQLKEAITQRLEKKEQVILFLNRRGYATSLQCPQCGYVAECPNCSVSLTYHRAAQKICCHICNYQEIAPTVCPEPKCRDPKIRYSGLGTEKVESTLIKLFPKAVIRRMDSDTLKRKEDYRNVLGDFKRGKIDILVGTQMIAKGLHFPNVTLVGIVYADLSLHVPDFRASERTFQLLTQVAGRAGRGDVEGEVFVQAFTPFHPSIQYARRHDYIGFYEEELEFRKQLKYPPEGRVALLTLKGRSEDKVKFSTDHVKRELEKSLGEMKDVVLTGPAPAPLARAETFFRYQIMLRTKQMTKLSQILNQLAATTTLPEEVWMTVDVDPVNLF